MSYTYDQRKRPQGPQNAAPEPDSAPVPNYQALMSGAARPTAEQKGRPFDLDAAMKAKMENAFGDLSGVKFYESRAVGQAGAEAIAQGNEIAFAPGMANFSTRSGQERLGHELSHVMSQRSGQVRGSGFLNNAALEARADREGAMAAAGQQVYAGPVTHALSDAGPSAFAAGSMQAKKDPEPTEEDNLAALNQLKSERRWGLAGYITSASKNLAFNESSKEKRMRMEQAESKATEEYLMMQMMQNQQNIPQNSDDDWNYSMIQDTAEGETGETGETSPEEGKIEVPESFMRPARQRAMIDHFTSGRRNVLHTNWDSFKDWYDDPDPENEDQREQAVFDRKLMSSKAFKKFSRDRKKYESMSYEDLERKFNKKWWQFWK